MSDDDVRSWAESWAGERLLFSAVYDEPLADAVREKAQEELMLDPWTRHDLGKTWFDSGAIAFMRAVMEIVQGSLDVNEDNANV